MAGRRKKRERERNIKKTVEFLNKVKLNRLKYKGQVE